MYLKEMNFNYTLIFILMLFIITKEINAEDLYKLLDVPKDATVREIRRAFKNLAIKMHPDKNMDDENAHDKFIKITQAYETLKDPETRKTYDIYGETETMKGSKPHYHSYSYYTDEFGIYDDDLLIVTLSKADYELNILDNNKAWFINFYSPHCHHCHTLAPAWRKLAVELEGIVRLGAVNCEEDWVLCRQLNINAYPTLLYYEKEAHLYEGEQYRAPKRLEDLRDFVLSKLTISERYISDIDWNEKDLKNDQWLLFLCPDDLSLCPEKETRLKVTATLEGLLPVGFITNPDLSSKISSDYRQNPVVFWKEQPHIITAFDSKEIVNGVLDLLPNPELLDENKFKEIRTQLRTGLSKPWLICFYMGTATELNLQLKRLPTMISNINIGLVHCGKSSGLCASIHVSHYPTWGVLKEGGAFELHHGRDILHEVAAFARDSIKSTNLHALSPADYLNIKNEGETWFIDWYAPWCPPCRKLMPEMRKASQHFTSNMIQFGTVDCTLHSKLCAQEDIRSYPTTIYYNGTSTQQLYHGVHNEEGIVEFVSDMLNPSVISLDESNFIQLMRKPENELWIVDYFAPWCGPCQRLAPQWRRLAKQMKDLSNVKVAQVDCVANSDLCNAQHIRGYPTIRLYPLGSKGLNTVALYNGHREVLDLKSWIFSFLPSLVKALSKAEFKSNILKQASDKPWLVDFYAPWCGHCVNFEPEFRIVAEMLQDKANVGKLDCEAERDFCHQLRVVSYPTVILYLSGDNYYHISSQVPNEIVEKVNNLIGSNKRFIHDEF